jgi:D-beta-D-heptose 7-phosphate kinase/D-beta-D-heptose 1-phosphate adenosyltransferase
MTLLFDHAEQVRRAVESGFGRARVLVVGDLMLDRYLWGEVNRISPESPVPVVRLLRQTEAAGGAANVAMNLVSLGLQVTVAGFVGDDEHRAGLLKLLHQAGVDTTPVVTTARRLTTVKTRIIGGHQQMLRLDVEDASESYREDVEALLAAVVNWLAAQRAGEPGAGGGLRAVILSDYAKGVLSARLCQAVIGDAGQHGVPVLVGPKGRDYRKYAGATAVVPNRAELALAANLPAPDVDALLAGGKALCEALGLEFMVVTRGERGITLIEAGRVQHVPATAREVFDVCGAGDTVIATLAAGLVAGLSRIDAVRLANTAAGIVVGKVGTVPIDRAELLTEIASQRNPEQADKICSLEVLLRRVEQWRQRGETIVFTNGCFDLLHAGHVIYLEQARRAGQQLIVGLNTDSSVQRIKGGNRPVIRQEDRARVLAALASVDAVVLFDEDTPINLICAVRPDVLVKGGDYTEDRVVGAEEVRSWGGKVLLIPYIEGHNTTDIIQRIESGRFGE